LLEQSRNLVESSLWINYCHTHRTISSTRKC